MKEEILANLNNPGYLEQLYRSKKKQFESEFEAIFDSVKDHPVAQAWNERLNYESAAINWGDMRQLSLVVLLALFAGLLVRIPDLFGVDPEYFYSRNISFLIFPLLAIFFVREKPMPLRQLIGLACVLLLSIVYINGLPDNRQSDTLLLTCIHMPVFIWALLGVCYAGREGNSVSGRIDFLRYNGDLLVMSAVILIAGGLISSATLVLFKLIGIDVADFYFRNVVVSGLAMVPLAGTYLVRVNPHLVNKVSPVIARLFTPVVVCMLAVYLVAVIYTGKDPYTDREFLLVFNLLLIGVMAMIFFSVVEADKTARGRWHTGLLFVLSVLTIIVNSVALSAILFRIATWGLTPNRIAVLGVNILLIVHLLQVSFALFQVWKGKREIMEVDRRLVGFLPVYVIWLLFVIFLLPVLWGFK